MSLDMQRAVVKALLAEKVLVTRQVLDELRDAGRLEEYYSKYVLKKVAGHEASVASSVVSSSEDVNKAVIGDVAGRVEVVYEYVDEPKKWVMQDFVSLFNERVRFLGRILQSRGELQNLTAISRLSGRALNDVVSVIGIVTDKQVTKNENIMLQVEDTSGGIVKVVFTKGKSELFVLAKDIVLDEVVGVCGVLGENIIFANAVVFPDVPLATEMKKCPREEYAVVLSDVHVGSALFLEREFKGFLSWIRGESGSEDQRAVAKKVRYVFVVGDLVDGVGIYPSQERELAVVDIFKQYERAAELIGQIPSDKVVIIGPGNHDAVRLAEPQPKLPRGVCASLWALPNVVMVTNPAVVRVGVSSDFPGFDVLMYHGYSYDYYGDVVESIRSSGRNISERTDLIMRFLLQKRHLAPSHTSTVYVPNPKKDPLIISQVPDVFLSGHVHRVGVNNYKGVLIVVGSCFQAKTGFQEKVGHEPTPCHVPVIGLHDRRVRIFNFENADSVSEKTLL